MEHRVSQWRTGCPFPLAAGTVLCTLAMTLTLPGQCQIEGRGVGIRGDRASVSAATAWDPDGSGPLPSTVVVAGAPPTLPGLISSVLNGKIATFDIATGTVQELGSATGAVRRMTVLATGELIVAGEFTAIDGVPRSYLASYDGTTWASLGASPNGPVDRLLVLGNGDLIAAGRFTAIGAQPMAHISRWDGTSWSALGTGVNDKIRTVALDANGNLIVGGEFTVAGGIAANHIASWNGTSWSALGLGTDSPVSTLTLLPNGHLAVGGYFLQAGGITAQCIADWDGANWSQLGGNANSFVIDSVLLPNGDLLVTGPFWEIAGQQIASNAIWNGTTWSAPTSPINAKVTATLAGGQQLLWPYVQTGSGYAVVGRGFNGYFYGADVDSMGNLYVTGTFTEVLGTPAVHIARYDGTNWSAVGGGIPTTAGGVYTMCVDANDEVFCGGYLNAATGSPGNYIVHWNGSAWTAPGGGTDARVDALLPRVGGGVIAGGAFTVAGNVAANGIAQWDGTAWSALGNVAGTCWGLGRLSNGDIIAVGYFTNPASRVIRWDGSTWAAVPGDFNSTVYCVAGLPDNSFVVGGIFTTVSGVAANGVARWDGSSWSALGATNSPGAQTSLSVLPNGDILAGASALNSTYGAVRWNGATWSSFARVVGPVLDYATMPDGSLVAVGRMTEAGGILVDGLAFLSSTCPATVVNLASGCSAPSLAIAVQELPWIGATHRVDGSGFANGSLAAVLVGLQSPGTVLSTLLPNALPGCRLLASPDSAVITVPAAGMTSLNLAIPRNTAFVGVQLFEQFLELQLLGSSQPMIGSSDGLRLVIGAF
jgi:trimeric autotransporter adhesin